MKIKLPTVTLIALTNKDFEGHKRAMDKSSEGIEWGGKKIIWDETIKDINDWNYKMLFELHNYVQTEFAMVIHADGYVVNPYAWMPEFLHYSYIGAPWPMPKDNYSYLTPAGELVRVGNSVSIRSKAIMELPSKLGLEFKDFHGNKNEDGKLCCEWRDILKAHGCTFAPLEVAKYFSKEIEIPENVGLETFAFHSI